MRVSKQDFKKLRPGQILTAVCLNAAELDSAYQTALKARKELGLNKADMRVTRLAKEMKVEVERKENSYGSDDT